MGRKGNGGGGDGGGGCNCGGKTERGGGGRREEEDADRVSHIHFWKSDSSFFLPRTCSFSLVRELCLLRVFLLKLFVNVTSELPLPPHEIFLGTFRYHQITRIRWELQSTVPDCRSSLHN